MTSTATGASRRRVLFIVPFQVRDLDGLALIGYILDKYYDVEVVYSNAYRIERKLIELRPDGVVFDHFVWDYKVRQARLARSFGMKLILLPTEGLHHDIEEGLRIAGKVSASTHLIDCHFTWGDNVRDAVLASHLSPEDRIHAVGCPRFDYYSPALRALVPDRSEFLRELGIGNVEAPVILWCTNSFYVSRDQEKILRRQMAQGCIPEAECRAMLRDGQTQLSAHSRVVLDLAKRHPDWNFVIKVHPAEWINPYAELVKQSANMFLAYNAPIRGFLAHCDVLLQRGCTTSTEAWMLGKPVLELAIGSFEKPVRQDLVAGNHVVRSTEQADRALQDYLSGTAIPAEMEVARQAFLAKFCYKIDGQSAMRCAALINKTISPPQHPDSDHVLMRELAAKAHAESVRSENQRFTNRVKDALGIPRERSLRIWKPLLNTEVRDNLGLFVAEADITPGMVQSVYEQLGQLPFLNDSANRAEEGLLAERT